MQKRKWTQEEEETLIRANWEEVESLNTTGRNGGFGSTGK